MKFPSAKNKFQPQLFSLYKENIITIKKLIPFEKNLQHPLMLNLILYEKCIL